MAKSSGSFCKFRPQFAVTRQILNRYKAHQKLPDTVQLPLSCDGVIDQIHEFDKKLLRLRTDPYTVGAPLHGSLHGKCATRLFSTHRIIFSIDDDQKCVFLITIDHRSKVYD